MPQTITVNIPEPQPDQLYSVADAAKLLACSRQAVARLLKAGKLRSMKIGRLRRVSAEAIRDFIRANEGR